MVLNASEIWIFRFSFDSDNDFFFFQLLNLLANTSLAIFLMHKALKPQVNKNQSHKH